MPLVLVTRPKGEAETTAERLRQRGLRPLISPLLSLEPLAFSWPDASFDAVAATSSRTFDAIPGALPARILNLPLFVVGARTADRAGASGFANIRTPRADESGVAALGSMLAKEPSIHNVLYLAGRDRSGDLGAILGPAGKKSTLIEIYLMAETPLTAEAQAALESGKVGAVLHYSRRTAGRFLAEAGQLAPSSPIHVCLSANVAEPLAAAGLTGLRLAQTPSEKAMLEEAEAALASAGN
ncbi:MAG: uroporphyrinogen-III synthase [Hyphomicrobiaceae bacterium]|nr:uroporphyrinogen-III synthase [Hyphomicrobiaceae bacterium]